MKYYKVKIYKDGRIIKEQIEESETRGYLKAGLFFHGGDEEYEFFIDEEKMIQKQYDKYRNKKLKECVTKMYQLQKLIKTLEIPVIV